MNIKWIKYMSRISKSSLQLNFPLKEFFFFIYHFILMLYIIFLYEIHLFTYLFFYFLYNLKDWHTKYYNSVWIFIEYTSLEYIILIKSERKKEKKNNKISKFSSRKTFNDLKITCSLVICASKLLNLCQK